jgi:hypothetical protein
MCGARKIDHRNVVSDATMLRQLERRGSPGDDLPRAVTDGHRASQIWMAPPGATTPPPRPAHPPSMPARRTRPASPAQGTLISSGCSTVHAAVPSAIASTMEYKSPQWASDRRISRRIGPRKSFETRQSTRLRGGRPVRSNLGNEQADIRSVRPPLCRRSSQVRKATLQTIPWPTPEIQACGVPGL